MFTLGAIVVLAGSVLLLKEHVRFCEYLGVILVIGGVILIALTKKEENLQEATLDGQYSIRLTVVASEGPGIATIFCKNFLISRHNRIVALWTQRADSQIHGNQKRNRWSHCQLDFPDDRRNYWWSHWAYSDPKWIGLR